MGFRSTITTEYYGRELPNWFKEKYQEAFHIEQSFISSKFEIKMYTYGSDLFEDYQKSLIENGLLERINKVNCVVLHEDGTINKVTITKDEITHYHMVEDYEIDKLWYQGY